MKTLIFVRHGKTAYTGQFPDLTDEGVRQISQAADEIAAIVEDRKNVQIVSSPLPRALGSADIIAKRLGHPHDIELEPSIRCMDFYDSEAAEAVWKSFPNARAVDLAYKNDPRFESGIIVERRSAIQHRFFAYLGSLFERFAAGNLPDVVIHTSHFEVLWDLAASFGFDEPLIHGEVIRLDLTPAHLDGGGLVYADMSFRGRSKLITCWIPSYAFQIQF